MSLTDVKDFAAIVQSVVIICVTMFTACWTYRTFAHKEKLQELKDLKLTVEEYHQAIKLFCAQVRETEQPDNREIQESMHLAVLHNKLVALARLNLYTKKEFRQKIQDIVGSWITNHRIQRMQRRPDWDQTEDERTALWKQFDSEYLKVIDLIDSQAGRFL